MTCVTEATATLSAAETGRQTDSRRGGGEGAYQNVRNRAGIRARSPYHAPYAPPENYSATSRTTTFPLTSAYGLTVTV